MRARQRAARRETQAPSAAVSPGALGGLASGGRRCTRSALARSGSRLVAKMCTPVALPITCSAREAAASITCSQLSSTINICLSSRQAASPASTFSELIVSPSAEATVLGTNWGSVSGAKSTNQTPVRVSSNVRFGRGESHSGLADATRTYNGDQPVPLQLPEERVDCVGTPDCSGR